MNNFLKNIFHRSRSAETHGQPDASLQFIDFEEALQNYRAAHPDHSIVCSTEGIPVVFRHNRKTQVDTFIVGKVITVIEPNPQDESYFKRIYEEIGSLPEAQTHTLAIAVLPGYTGGDDTDIYIIIQMQPREVEPEIGIDYAPIY